MARNVEDLALLLDAMSGEHPADPLSLPLLPHRSCPPHAPARGRNASPIRPISASPRSIPKLPPSPEGRGTLRRGRRHLSRKRIPTCARPMNASMCCARSISRSPRRRCCAASASCSSRKSSGNIEEGLKLTVEQLERAEAQRVAMTARTLEFFETYDLLLTPATIVAPFPCRESLCRRMRGQEIRQLRRVARHRLCDYAGLLSGAVVAVRIHRVGPAGRTANGGAARGEAQLLAGARLLEDVLGVRGTAPIDPRPAK